MMDFHAHVLLSSTKTGSHTSAALTFELHNGRSLATGGEAVRIMREIQAASTKITGMTGVLLVVDDDARIGRSIPIDSV